MDNLDLLTETNMLLKEYMERQKKAAADAEQQKLKFDQEMAEMEQKRNEYMKDKLREEGVPDIELDSDEDFESKLEMMRKRREERSKQQLAAAEQYKVDILGELTKQTSLMEKIAEKLGV